MKSLQDTNQRSLKDYNSKNSLQEYQQQGLGVVDNKPSKNDNTLEYQISTIKQQNQNLLNQLTSMGVSERAIEKVNDNRNMLQRILNLNENQGLITGTLEIINRPAEALQGLLASGFQGTNIFKAMYRGLSGKQEYSLKDLGVEFENPLANALANLGFEIAADPFNFLDLPIGWITKGAKGYAKTLKSKFAMFASKSPQGQEIYNTVSELTTKVYETFKKTFGTWNNKNFKNFNNEVANIHTQVKRQVKQAQELNVEFAQQINNLAKETADHWTKFSASEQQAFINALELDKGFTQKLLDINTKVEMEDMLTNSLGKFVFKHIEKDFTHGDNLLTTLQDLVTGERPWFEFAAESLDEVLGSKMYKEISQFVKWSMKDARINKYNIEDLIKISKTDDVFKQSIGGYMRDATGQPITNVGTWTKGFKIELTDNGKRYVEKYFWKIKQNKLINKSLRGVDLSTHDRILMDFATQNKVMINTNSADSMDALRELESFSKKLLGKKLQYISYEHPNGWLEIRFAPNKQQASYIKQLDKQISQFDDRIESIGEKLAKVRGLELQQSFLTDLEKNQIDIVYDYILKHPESLTPVSVDKVKKPVSFLENWFAPNKQQASYTKQLDKHMSQVDEEAQQSFLTDITYDDIIKNPELLTSVDVDKAKEQVSFFADEIYKPIAELEQRFKEKGYIPMQIPHSNSVQKFQQSSLGFKDYVKHMRQEYSKTSGISDNGWIKINYKKATIKGKCYYIPMEFNWKKLQKLEQFNIMSYMFQKGVLDESWLSSQGITSLQDLYKTDVTKLIPHNFLGITLQQGKQFRDFIGIGEWVPDGYLLDMENIEDIIDLSLNNILNGNLVDRKHFNRLKDFFSRETTLQWVDKNRKLLAEDITTLIDANKVTRKELNKTIKNIGKEYEKYDIEQLQILETTFETGVYDPIYDTKVQQTLKRYTENKYGEAKDINALLEQDIRKTVLNSNSLNRSYNFNENKLKGIRKQLALHKKEFKKINMSISRLKLTPTNLKTLNELLGDIYIYRNNSGRFVFSGDVPEVGEYATITQRTKDLILKQDMLVKKNIELTKDIESINGEAIELDLALEMNRHPDMKYSRESLLKLKEQEFVRMNDTVTGELLANLQPDFKNKLFQDEVKAKRKQVNTLAREIRKLGKEMVELENDIKQGLTLKSAKVKKQAQKVQKKLIKDLDVKLKKQQQNINTTQPIVDKLNDLESFYFNNQDKEFLSVDDIPSWLEPSIQKKLKNLFKRKEQMDSDDFFDELDTIMDKELSYYIPEYTKKNKREFNFDERDNTWYSNAEEEQSVSKAGVTFEEYAKEVIQKLDMPIYNYEFSNISNSIYLNDNTIRISDHLRPQQGSFKADPNAAHFQFIMDKNTNVKKRVAELKAEQEQGNFLTDVEQKEREALEELPALQEQQKELQTQWASKKKERDDYIAGDYTNFKEVPVETTTKTVTDNIANDNYVPTSPLNEADLFYRNNQYVKPLYEDMRQLNELFRVNKFVETIKDTSTIKAMQILPDLFAKSVERISGVQMSVQASISRLFKQIYGIDCDKWNVGGYLRHMLSPEHASLSAIVKQVEGKYGATSSELFGRNLKKLAIHRKYQGSAVNINEAFGFELFNTSPVQATAMMLEILPQSFTLGGVFKNIFETNMIQKVNHLLDINTKGLDDIVKVNKTQLADLEKVKKKTPYQLKLINEHKETIAQIKEYKDLLQRQENLSKSAQTAQQTNRTVAANVAELTKEQDLLKERLKYAEQRQFHNELDNLTLQIDALDEKIAEAKKGFVKYTEDDAVKQELETIQMRISQLANDINYQTTKSFVDNDGWLHNNEMFGKEFTWLKSDMVRNMKSQFELVAKATDNQKLLGKDWVKDFDAMIKEIEDGTSHYTIHKGVFESVKRFATRSGHSDAKQIWAALQKYITLPFKQFALFSSGFHIRNLMTNYSNAYLAGINPIDLHKGMMVARKELLEFEKVLFNINEQLATGSYRSADEQIEMINKILDADVEKRALWDDYFSMMNKGIIGNNQFNQDILQLMNNIKRQAMGKSIGVDVKDISKTFKTVHGKFKTLIEKSMIWSKHADDYAKISMYRLVRDEEKYQHLLDSHNGSAELFTKFVLFDYNNLTHAEETYMKALFPFYTWARKNLEFHLRNFGKNFKLYDRLYSAIQGWREGIVGDDDNEQEYHENYMPIWNENGKITYVKFKPAYEDVDNWLNGSALVNSLTPIIKTPLEMITGYDFFAHREFDTHGVMPGFGLGFNNLLGTTKVITDMLFNGYTPTYEDKKLAGVIGKKLLDVTQVIKNAMSFGSNARNDGLINAVSQLFPSVFTTNDTQLSQYYNAKERQEQLQEAIKIYEKNK